VLKQPLSVFFVVARLPLPLVTSCLAVELDGFGSIVRRSAGVVNPSTFQTARVVNMPLCDSGLIRQLCFSEFGGIEALVRHVASA
jgi:hypothetical protein